MPTNSMKQHRLMEAVAKEPGVAKKTGIPRSVGQEFASADEAKMRGGGKLGAGKPTAGSKKRSPAELMAAANALSKLGRK